MKKLLTVVCICATLSALEKIRMEKIDPPPKYLYKILSIENWQATQNRKTVQLSTDDDAFIHFSTENQLDKIVQKYWSDVPQLVILKIHTEQLKGNLVFEANPGGVTKYYHLYDGFIPFDAIIEAKISSIESQ